LVVKDARFKAASYDCDQYMIANEGDFLYYEPRFVRNALPWHYVGVTHEYIDTKRPGMRRGRCTALAVVHHGDGGSRADKFERDVRLLTASLAVDPTNSRDVFYLANSHRDLGENERAIELYTKRAEMGGFAEEVYHSLYQIGVCNQRMGLPFLQQIGIFLRAYAYMPARLEALYKVVNGCRLNGFPDLGASLGCAALLTPFPTECDLFVERDVHEWRFWDELSVCCFYSPKHRDIGRMLVARLLRERFFGPEEEEHIRNNERLFSTLPAPSVAEAAAARTALITLDALGVAALRGTSAPAILNAASPAPVSLPPAPSNVPATTTRVAAPSTAVGAEEESIYATPVVSRAQEAAGQRLRGRGGRAHQRTSRGARGRAQRYRSPPGQT
jgi:tetratricopeptide (TPR) repeat protein